MKTFKDEIDEGKHFEAWLNRQLTGDLATGNLNTELRMAVATIRDMPNIPKDYAVQPLMKLIKQSQIDLLKRLEEQKQSWAMHGGWSPEAVPVDTITHEIERIERGE